MSYTETTAPLRLGPAAETFCVYLAKHLVKKRGFSPGAPPEAAVIAAQSDVVLSFSDGYSFTIVAMVDREVYPYRGFDLTPEEIGDIGQACLKYCGRINAARLPVTIHLIEVGPASVDQIERLAEIKRPSLFSRIIPSAFVVDTEAGAVWTSTPWQGRGMRRYLERLLAAPRERLIARPPLAVAAGGFPWLTAGIVAMLVAVFAAEVVCGVGGLSLEPSIATLLAFGGLARNLTVAGGEWHRLLSAPFLHGDIVHLFMNAVSLAVAGYVLESLIGRAWFAAVYVVGALCGSLVSLLINPDNLVSVGASGAVMGLFAAMLIVSRRFPPGPLRGRLQTNAIYVLIPSLLPLASAFKGVKVDYAAHFGGAIGGAAVAMLALFLWRRTSARPQLRALALAVALAGAAACTAAAVLVYNYYPAYAFSPVLAPQAELPTSDTAARERSADLATRFPRDPRIRLIRASALLQSADLPGAERELRAGLAEEAVWSHLFSGELAVRLRTLLALVLVETSRANEAKGVAAPACRASKSGELREALDRQKLCVD